MRRLLPLFIVFTAVIAQDQIQNPIFRSKRPRYPSWFSEVSESGKLEIARIAANRDLTLEQKESRLSAVIDNEAESVREAYRKETSYDANGARKKISNIMKDKSISPKTRRRLVKEVIDDMPETVRDDVFPRNRVAEKMRELGRQIGEVQQGLLDGFRMAIGPMRRHRYRPSLSTTTVSSPPVQPQAPLMTLDDTANELRLEARPFQISEDGQFVQV